MYTTTDRLIVGALIVAIVATIAAIVYSLTQPSCEERGGELVFSHMAVTLVYNGTTMVPITTPIYICKGARDDV